MKSIYNGRYVWDGKKRGGSEPISWFPGAYDLKIIRLQSEKKGVTYLKPYMCIFTNTGSGYSVSANPVKFAKKICEEFSLEIEKVIWVEREDCKSEKYEVIQFKKSGMVGGHDFYTFHKREPMKSELQIIQQKEC